MNFNSLLVGTFFGMFAMAGLQAACAQQPSVAVGHIPVESTQEQASPLEEAICPPCPVCPAPKVAPDLKAVNTALEAIQKVEEQQKMQIIGPKP